MANEPHADYRLFILANAWLLLWFLTSIEKKRSDGYRRAIADVERHGRQNEYYIRLLAGYCNLYVEKNATHYFLSRTPFE
jgi:hypothetical protein